MIFRCCDELVARFKEREENVRTDVVGCFSKLLEAAFTAGGASSRDPAGVPTLGNGGAAGIRDAAAKEPSKGRHHEYYHPHPPEAPKQLVRPYLHPTTTGETCPGPGPYDSSVLCHV